MSGSLRKINLRTIKCPVENRHLGGDTKPTHPCGTFGQICAKLCWASGQHNPAKEWMGDDLNGSGWQLFFLLLTGQLHHLLHETHTVLCCHCTHRLCVCVCVPQQKEGERERQFEKVRMERKPYLREIGRRQVS